MSWVILMIVLMVIWLSSIAALAWSIRHAQMLDDDAFMEVFMDDREDKR